MSAGRLRARTVPVAAISPAEQQAMWALFSRIYEHVEHERFLSDLHEKDHVFVLVDGDRLAGFSTVQVQPVSVHGRTIVSVYSGDTVIDPAYHGQSALQWAFFRYIAATKLRNPHRMVVWFLISKGYKTYLLLTRNFPDHWPRRDQPVPGWARELIDTLAAGRFGPLYEPETLLLRMHGEHGRLRPDVAPVDGQADPDIRYFVQANPGHAEGDELCCIGLVNARLVLGYPFKLLRRLLRGPSPRPST